MDFHGSRNKLEPTRSEVRMGRADGSYTTSASVSFFLVCVCMHSGRLSDGWGFKLAASFCDNGVGRRDMTTCSIALTFSTWILLKPRSPAPNACKRNTYHIISYHITHSSNSTRAPVHPSGRTCIHDTDSYHTLTYSQRLKETARNNIHVHGIHTLRARIPRFRVPSPDSPDVHGNRKP